MSKHVIFKPRANKIATVLSYIKDMQPGISDTRSVYYTYLADREHFLEYGRPITFDRYYATDTGIVSSITSANIVEDVDYKELSVSDIEAISRVIKKYSDMSNNEIFETVRSFREWATCRNQKGSEMYYDEMIADQSKRKQYVSDYADISTYMI